MKERIERNKKKGVGDSLCTMGLPLVLSLLGVSLSPLGIHLDSASFD